MAKEKVNYEEILQLIKEQESIQVKMNENQNVSPIIFIGDTGVGKSTIINYLMGVKLVAFRQSSNNKIKIMDGQNESSLPKIGHSTRSETCEPKLYKKLVGNNYFCDLPGFSDTRGEMEELKSALAYRNTFGKFEKFKVIFVLSQEQIAATRAGSIINNIKLLSKQFPDFNSLKPSFGLIISKGDSFAREEYRKSLEEIYDHHNISGKFSDGEKRIFEYLFSEECPVTFFDRPTDEEVRSRNIIVTNGHDNISNLIGNLEFVGPISTDYSLSASAQVQIADFITDSKHKIDSKLKTFVEQIGDKLKEKLDSCHDYQKLKTECEKISQDLQKVHSLIKSSSSSENKQQQLANAAKHSEEISKILSSLSQDLNIKDISPRLLEYMSALNSIVRLGIDSRLDFDFPSYISAAAENIDSIFKISHTEISQIKEIVRFYGFIVDTKYINDSAIVTHSVKEVRVFALNTFMINEDITLPSKDLVVIAPKWKVSSGSKKIINLSGAKGEDGASGSSDYNDGLHGKPGKNSGNFYGRGEIFEGIELLSIIANGGDGGRGGDGKNGEKGLSGDVNMVTNRNKDAMLARTSVGFFQSKDFGVNKGEQAAKFVLTYNTIFLEMYFSPGKEGTLGGRAGHGGYAGKSGEVTLRGLNGIKIELNFTARDGEEGKEGKSGFNGEFGDSHYGEFKEEKVAPIIRGILDSKKNLKTKKILDSLDKIDIEASKSQMSEIAFKIIREALNKYYDDMKMDAIAKAENDFKATGDMKQSFTRKVLNLITSKEYFRTQMMISYKQILSSGIEVGIKEGMKSTAKLAVSSSTKVGVSLASAGIAIAVTAVMSSVSAYTSNAWKKDISTLKNKPPKLVTGFNSSSREKPLEKKLITNSVSPEVDYKIMLFDLEKTPGKKWIKKWDGQLLISKNDKNIAAQQQVEEFLVDIENNLTHSQLGEIVMGFEHDMELSEEVKLHLMKNEYKLLDILNILAQNKNFAAIALMIDKKIISQKMLQEYIKELVNRSNQSPEEHYIIKELCNIPGVDLEDMIHFAIDAANRQIIEFLIQRGVDINCKKDGTTLLLRIIANGNYNEADADLVILLLKLGVNTDARNLDGKRAIDIAKEMRNGFFISCLNAFLNGKPDDGVDADTSLHYTIKDTNGGVYVLIKNPGDGDCAVHSIIQVLNRDKSELQSVREEISDTMKNFIAFNIYFKQVGANRQMLNSDEIIGLYRNIFFGEQGFNVFKHLVIKTMRSPFDDIDTSEETIQELKKYIDLLSPACDWNFLSGRDELVRKIFDTCSIFGIEVESTLADHYLTADCSPEEYRDIASKPGVWLCNNEISAYLLTLGFELEERISSPSQEQDYGTLLKFKHILDKDKIIYLHNDSTSNPLLNYTPGTHWSAVEKVYVPSVDDANLSDAAYNSGGKPVCGYDYRDEDIGYIAKSFGKYTLSGISDILELRLIAIGRGNMVIKPCEFKGLDDENIEVKIEEVLKILTEGERDKILMPTSLFDKHAVGMVIEKLKEEESLSFKATYMDSEGKEMPDYLRNILEANNILVRKFEVEEQRYANCGPEVVENFIYYLTGRRLSQEEAIEMHSKLIEFALIKGCDNNEQKDKLEEFYSEGFSTDHESKDLLDYIGDS